MRIEPWGGGLSGRRIEASSRELNDGGHLFVGQVKPLHDFADRGSCFQIVKHN
jgi:hypothetical protein